MDDDLLAWLTPDGEGTPEVLLYALRPRDRQDLRAPDASGWPDGTTIRHVVLADDDWTFAVDLFEVRLPARIDLAALRPLVRGALDDLAAQGPAVAWAMLDGVFGDVSALFNEWHTAGTYAVAWPGEPARLELSGAGRAGADWARTLARASERIDRELPSVRAASAD